MKAPDGDTGVVMTKTKSAFVPLAFFPFSSLFFFSHVFSKRTPILAIGRQRTITTVHLFARLRLSCLLGSKKEEPRWRLCRLPSSGEANLFPVSRPRRPSVSLCEPPYRGTRPCGGHAPAQSRPPPPRRTRSFPHRREKRKRKKRLPHITSSLLHTRSLLRFGHLSSVLIVGAEPLPASTERGSRFSCEAYALASLPAAFHGRTPQGHTEATLTPCRALSRRLCFARARNDRTKTKSEGEKCMLF